MAMADRVDDDVTLTKYPKGKARRVDDGRIAMRIKSGEGTSINGHLTASAHHRLGDAEWVHIYTSDDPPVVGISPADEGDPDSYSAKHRVLSLTGPIRNGVGAEVDGTWVVEGEWDDDFGGLVFDVSEVVDRV